MCVVQKKARKWHLNAHTFEHRMEKDMQIFWVIQFNEGDEKMQHEKMVCLEKHTLIHNENSAEDLTRVTAFLWNEIWKKISHTRFRTPEVQRNVSSATLSH